MPIIKVAKSTVVGAVFGFGAAFVVDIVIWLWGTISYTKQAASASIDWVNLYFPLTAGSIGFLVAFVPELLAHVNRAAKSRRQNRESLQRLETGKTLLFGRAQNGLRVLTDEETRVTTLENIFDYSGGLPKAPMPECFFYTESTNLIDQWRSILNQLQLSLIIRKRCSGPTLPAAAALG